MKKIIIKDGKIPNLDANVACIGYFDGVHLGHQSLIRVTKDIARMNNQKSMIICFDPDPEDVINNNKNKHILSFNERLIKFSEYGFDYCCVLSFDKKLMDTTPIDFINNYLLKLNISKLICGFDYSFGAKGKGDIKLLAKYLDIIVIDEKKYYGKKISSTRIKHEILNGNFKLANKLLNYDYSYKCKIIECKKNGIYYLVVYKPINKNLILPKQGKYNGYTIINNCFVFKSKVKKELNSLENIVLK